MFLDFREALRLEAQLNDLSEQDQTLTTRDANSDTVQPNLQKARRGKNILMMAHSRWTTLISTNKEDVENPIFDKFRCGKIEHI